MKHFLYYIEDSIKNNWDKPAVSNYGANGFTYGEVAARVAKLHVLFECYGIAKGEHVAIAARNSAEWCVAFIGITSYGAVAVPLLPDFLPENIIQLTKLSDSRLLFVDKNILAALKRDGHSAAFDSSEAFIGVFDICSYSPVEGCKCNTCVLPDDVEKEFEKKYPAGVSVSDVD